MGPFDILFGIPQARAQIAAGLGQAPGQPGNPAGPQPIAGPPPAAGGPPGGGAGAGPPTGAAPPGGAAAGPPQGPPAAPPQPQAYQSPPDLIGMYMQLAQRQQASESFDRHLGMMAASMYPGRRPDIVMQGMTDPHQDPGAMFNNILQLQQYSQQQGAFNRAAPDIAKQLNMTVDEVMARGPAGVQTLLDAQRQAQAPTDAMKNAEAATKAWASANPGATPAEIEEYKGNMLAQTVSNMDPATRAWSNAVRIWRSDPANKDQPLPPGMKDPLTYAGTVAEHAKTIEHAADEKASAITSFPTISASWDHTVKMIDWLTDPAHIDAVRTAIQTPGGGAALNPLASQDEKDARGYLDTLGNQQFRSGMQDVKNIRSQQEANKVGGSMSSLDRMGNSNKAIDEELARLKDIAYRGFATVTAAAGRQVPAKFKGKADQTYLDRNSPYYNGATEEEPPAEGGGGQASGGQASGALKPMPDATKKAAQARIAQEPGVRAELMDHLRQQGFDPTGL